ncbi:MAG: hypothetical protein COA84_06630 [Robiginitomaculum sp.]|nr:MAG: hypothetical protein COA84_06630 [Robiginitomaculum sp.]
MAACEPPAGDGTAAKAGPKVDVSTSASLGPFDGHINAITFAPVATVPWEGRLVIAARDGGLKVIDIEGEEDSQWQGGTMTALAASPGFNLRGLNTSLVLALKDDGTLASFIVDDARGQLIEAPVSGLPADNITALCAVDTEAEDPFFLIGRGDKSLAVWKISDTGAAALTAEAIKKGTLAIAISDCTAWGKNAVATGQKGGLFSLSINDSIRMLQGVESAPGKVTAMIRDDKSIILISDPAAGNMRAYDENLFPLYTLSTPKALSTPGAANPGALAVSSRSFGGAGFSAGLMAVADDSTNRIALVVLDTVPLQAKTSDS